MIQLFLSCTLGCFVSIAMKGIGDTGNTVPVRQYSYFCAGRRDWRAVVLVGARRFNRAVPNQYAVSCRYGTWYPHTWCLTTTGYRYSILCSSGFRHRLIAALISTSLCHHTQLAEMSSIKAILAPFTQAGPLSGQQPAICSALAVLAFSTFYWMTTSYKASKRVLPPGYTSIPHLVSWIPFIGSAVEFQRGHIRDFIKRSAAKLQAPAFTATVMGDKCLFIADSQLINFIFRDSKQLDGLTFQKRFLRNVTGFTQAQTEVLFDESTGTPRSVMQLFHKYLLKDDALERTLRISQDILLKEIDKLVTPSENPAVVWTRQHLFNFTSTAVFRASAGPVLSMNLIPNHEEHLKDLRNFEKGLGLLFVGAPNFMAPDCVRARGSLISLFMSDLVLSAESPFLQERRETLMKGLSSTEEFKDDMSFTIARNNLGVFLASVGNSIQAVFWTLLNLMENQEAYEACFQAVQKVAAKREAGREWFTLEELDELMVLQSAFYETLRMYQALFVTRQAVEDFCLNPKETKGPKYIVEKGTMIMVLPNLMHMDPEIFENPETFQYDRFLDPQATSKQGSSKLSSHLRPFGGGVHMCPGRKFIGYEARAMLAMILLKYEMRIRPGETRPGIDFSRQGMSVGVPERDVEIEVRARMYNSGDGF